MKKRKLSIKKLKLNKMGFKSGVSIYKEKFSDNEITFRPKFSIQQNLFFPMLIEQRNKFAKAFENFKPL